MYQIQKKKKRNIQASVNGSVKPTSHLSTLILRLLLHHKEITYRKYQKWFWGFEPGGLGSG